MRELADATRLQAFMCALGTPATGPGRVYLMGGATAVLHGWRSTTIDADIWLVPDSDALLRAIVGLKESLRLNVELVAPGQFLPELPGWTERSAFRGKTSSQGKERSGRNRRAVGSLAARVPPRSEPRRSH